MSREQAESRALSWSRMASTRHPSLNYRAEPAGEKGQWRVMQYLGDHPVAIAMS